MRRTDQGHVLRHCYPGPFSFFQMCCEDFGICSEFNMCFKEFGMRLGEFGMCCA